MRLQEFSNTNRICTNKNSTTPSMNLLLRFQRLLIAKIYTQDVNCLQAAESLLKKYLYQLSTQITATLNLAHEIAMSNPRNYMYVIHILKGDVLGTILRIFRCRRLINI